MKTADYIAKLKADRREQYEKTRELKIAIAKSVRLLFMGYDVDGITKLLEALALPENTTRAELETFLATMEKAVQDEAQKGKVANGQ